MLNRDEEKEDEENPATLVRSKTKKVLKKSTDLLRQATHESAQLGKSDLGRRRSKIDNYINLSLLSLSGK